jgi:hypothetical protein
MVIRLMKPEFDILKMNNIDEKVHSILGIKPRIVSDKTAHVFRITIANATHASLVSNVSKYLKDSETQIESRVINHPQLTNLFSIPTPLDGFNSARP